MTISDLKFCQKLKVKFLAKLLSAYPFVHKLEKIYININDRKITTKVGQTQKKIIDDKMNSEAFEKVKKIIKNRQTNGKNKGE
jgi:hypothetical protein